MTAGSWLLCDGVLHSYWVGFGLLGFTTGFCYVRQLLLLLFGDVIPLCYYKLWVESVAAGDKVSVLLGCWFDPLSKSATTVAGSCVISFFY